MATPVLRKMNKGDDKSNYYAFWSVARKSKRKSMGSPDEAVAEERFATWLLLRNDKTPTLARSVKACWTVYWLKHLSENSASPETALYSWKALEPYFGEMRADEVDQDAVDSYMARRTGGLLGRAVKEPTVRRELQLLCACLNFCTRQKMHKPEAVQRIKLPEGSEPRDRWLTTAEIQALLDAAARLRRGPRLSRTERFIWLALATGARVSSLLDLTWDRVDFETNVIHLAVPGRRKTKKRRPSVPISADLRQVLERAYAERIGDRVLDGPTPVWTSLQTVVIEAGLSGGQKRPTGNTSPKSTGISPHVLRHTAATHMARRGVPLWIIAKILGNSLQVVEKTYAKHSPDDLREAVNLISNGSVRAQP